MKNKYYLLFSYNEQYNSYEIENREKTNSYSVELFENK